MLMENPNLDEIRGLETADPQEATLGRSHPHPIYQVEYIRFCSHSLYLEYLVVVRNISIDDDPQIAVRQTRMQPRPKLRH